MCNNKNKKKSNMKNRRTYSRTILPALLVALGLGVLSSPAMRADDNDRDNDNNRSIVGLWDTHCYSGGAELFETHVQWHRDGLEFDINSIYPGAVCMGVGGISATGTDVY